MCHWNTVNWNCIIRKETLEEKLSEEEKHALSSLQKELSEQKKVELLFTDADMEKDITFFLSGHHVKPEECMLLATEPEEVAWAKKNADSDSDQLTIIGYEVPDFSKQIPLSNVDMLLLGLEEVDTEFLLRTFQRKHHLPWRILETKRCYLREIYLIYIIRRESPIISRPFTKGRKRRSTREHILKICMATMDMACGWQRKKVPTG